MDRAKHLARAVDGSKHLARERALPALIPGLTAGPWTGPALIPGLAGPWTGPDGTWVLVKPQLGRALDLSADRAKN